MSRFFIQSLLSGFILTCPFFGETQTIAKQDFYDNFPGKTQRLNRLWAQHDRSPQIPNEIVYTLPVVFHIIHQDGSENISDAAVLEALDILNLGFANAGTFDQGTGVNTNIQFCLAKVDPKGQATTGINHVYADFPKVIPAINDDVLKGFIDWDPPRYINIWVVKDMYLLIEDNTCDSEDLLAAGYATLPSSHGAPTDGIVAKADALKDVIIHEMGHYLGLLHTFEQGCTNDDCAANGDLVCDTPPQKIRGAKCDGSSNSCTTDTQSGFATDQNDYPGNFMDYTFCQNDFTQGQKDRMRFMIENARQSLLAQNTCSPVCTDPLDAGFDFQKSLLKIGDAVHFVANQPGNLHAWSVNDQPASNSADLDFTFTSQGWFKISHTLYTGSGIDSCKNEQVNWVRVYCATVPSITVSANKVADGETVHFTGNEVVLKNNGSLSYRWFANQDAFSDQKITDHAFSDPGIKSIHLEITSGNCVDTSNYELVDVKEPPDLTINMLGVSCDSVNRKFFFSVCNEGFFPLPPGLPVSFYDDNPTTSNSNLVGQVYLTQNRIGNFCCENFEAILPSDFKGTKIYGVVNDNATLSRPYSFSQFPVTSILESNYGNNLDSITTKAFDLQILPHDTTVDVGTPVAITVIAPPVNSLLWSADFGTFNCDTCLQTSFTTSFNSIITAIAVDSNGCKASDTAYVNVTATGEIQVPNAFTPNDDSHNDVFYILGGGSVKRVEKMSIYNRLGQKVFERRNFLPNQRAEGWDGTFKGKRLTSQVFVYYFTVEMNDGKKKNYKGIVTLVR